MDELTEQIDKFEKRLDALESGLRRDSLAKKIENLKAARTELLEAEGVNQSYHFQKGFPEGQAPKLWELRAILENTEEEPVDQVDMQASHYVTAQNEASTLKSMKLMLDKGHYEFPKLRAAIETRLNQLR